MAYKRPYLKIHEMLVTDEPFFPTEIVGCCRIRTYGFRKFL